MARSQRNPVRCKNAMKQSFYRQIVFFGLVSTSIVRAEFPTSQPYPGITYHAEARKDPPMHLFIAEVDLTKPQVHVRVTAGGADPDGPGEWETTLMKPSAIAAREGFDLTVN